MRAWSVLRQLLAATLCALLVAPAYAGESTLPPSSSIPSHTYDAESGEIFFKDSATKHLEQLLTRKAVGTAGATKLAAALAIDEAKTAIETVAAQGFEAIAGKLVTTQVGDFTVEIIINAQPGEAVPWAVTHLLFR